MKKVFECSGLLGITYTGCTGIGSFSDYLHSGNGHEGGWENRFGLGILASL